MKSPSDNIEFQSTILSRFDLIFIVKDVSDVKRDEALAMHIINVHKNRDQALAVAGELAIDAEKLKKYSLSLAFFFWFFFLVLFLSLVFLMTRTNEKMDVCVQGDPLSPVSMATKDSTLTQRTSNKVRKRKKKKEKARKRRKRECVCVLLTKPFRGTTLMVEYTDRPGHILFLSSP